jgi:cell division protein FtsW (lipid II flippase)
MVVAAVLLMGLGWLGIARCEELTGGSGRFLRQQLVWSLLGIAAMLGTTIPSYRILSRWSYAALAVALGLLVLVYFFPPINGARRWIRVGMFSLQPSELAKVAWVLAMARYLMYRENHRRLVGVLWPLALTLVPVVLILREPDLGTALVFLPVLFVMLAAAGASRADLVGLVLAGLLAMPLLWTQMSHEQKSRVTSLFQQAGVGETALGDAYHLRQAKQVLSLGGVWGSLLAGQVVEDPAAYHLPEARTDFIFCILKERLGLPGVALVLGLHAFLVWRGLAIAAATREPFARLVAVGVSSLLAVQVLINTGMTVGLLPITGVSLPLVSYGGSGLLAHSLVLGLLVNIGLRPGYEVAREPFRYAPAGNVARRSRLRSV